MQLGWPVGYNDGALAANWRLSSWSFRPGNGAGPILNYMAALYVWQAIIFLPCGFFLLLLSFFFPLL